MKKFLNDGNTYVDEMLDGLCEANPDFYSRLGDSGRVLARAVCPVVGKVGIVTGGGSGHLPVFHGYVGHGLLDACAVGNVFAGPRMHDCLAAMRAANGSAGVLQLYGNYGGDRMNFEMAKDLAELEGIEVTTVRLSDDVASAPPESRELRRGVAGMVYAFKIAGAKAEQRSSLAEVTSVAKKAADACRSIGVALTPCIVPEVGNATFEISEGEVEFGMGIHGEPGIWRGKMKSADELAAEMLDRLFSELHTTPGDRMSVLVNSLGATPLEELYIIYRKVAQMLRQKRITPVMPLIGRFATSMEMAGASLTLLPLDVELESLLKAPASSPFWNVL
ncbi:MAG: dihydroxyacetone kinase subunit DhaK [Acidobacteriaceae bacterium]